MEQTVIRFGISGIELGRSKHHIAEPFWLLISVHDPKTLDSPEHELSEYVAKFNVTFTDDITGQARSKVRVLPSVIAGFTWQNTRRSRVKAALLVL